MFLKWLNIPIDALRSMPRYLWPLSNYGRLQWQTSRTPAPSLLHDFRREPSHLEGDEPQTGQRVDAASVLPKHGHDFVHLSDCCAGACALMALAAGIRKGQGDGNLGSVFANAVSGYWFFCLGTFREEAFLSEAWDSRGVWRAYWDSWSAPDVDLALSGAHHWENLVASSGNAYINKVSDR